MRLTVTGRRVEISEAFRQSAEDGLKEFCEKYQVDPVEATVILSKSGFNFQIDVHVHLNRGVDLRASAQHQDAYAGFAGVVDLLGTRIRRHKKRLVDHHKHHDNHAKESVPYFILNGDILESTTEDVTGEELSPAIIAEVSTDIPTLSVGDAVMRMDLGATNVFLFRNTLNQRINFVYRRNDGNIGWIDPNTK